MITSIFLYIVGLFISILQSLLQAIALVIPTDIQTSMAYLAGYFGYLAPVVNFVALTQAFSFYFIAISGWFTFLALMWVWHKMPFVGKPSMPASKQT